MSNERISYQGKIIEVVEQDIKVGDKIQTFEMARRSPGTRTIICSNQNRILLTREYRHEVSGYDYRLPGGKVFDTLQEYNKFLSTNPTNEARLAVAVIGAQKELNEEVGLKNANLEFLSLSKCGATVEWDLYYFVTKVDETDLVEQSLEHGEDITTDWYTYHQVNEFALSKDKMSEERSVAVLLRYLNNLGN